LTKEIRNLCSEFQQKKLKTMSEFIITNVAMMQRRKYYIGVSMNESTMTNVITTQRRRCCSFDSPGLARNKPTLGKHSQGDSTL